MRAIHDVHAPGTDPLQKPVVAKDPADQIMVFRSDRPSSNPARQPSQARIVHGANHQADLSADGGAGRACQVTFSVRRVVTSRPS